MIAITYLHLPWLTQCLLLVVAATIEYHLLHPRPLQPSELLVVVLALLCAVAALALLVVATLALSVVVPLVVPLSASVVVPLAASVVVPLAMPAVAGAAPTTRRWLAVTLREDPWVAAC